MAQIRLLKLAKLAIFVKDAANLLRGARPFRFTLRDEPMRGRLPALSMRAQLDSTGEMKSAIRSNP